MATAKEDLLADVMFIANTADPLVGPHDPRESHLSYFSVAEKWIYVDM